MYAAAQADKKMIQATYTAAENNRKMLEKLLKEWQKLAKHENQWHQSTIKNAIDKHSKLFAKHRGINPIDYMREKLAPRQRGLIIDYIVCSMLTEKDDEPERDRIADKLSELCKQVCRMLQRLDTHKAFAQRALLPTSLPADSMMSTLRLVSLLTAKRLTAADFIYHDPD